MPTNHLTYAKTLIKLCQQTQNSYLDLGNCRITNLNDLPELFECTHLKTLILSNEWWDYEKKKDSKSRNTGKENHLHSLPAKIANLKNLTKLILSGRYNGWEISDISFLSKLNKLKYLNLSNNKIHDIHYLKKLTGLQTLSLGENQISDIRSLSNLTGLQTLSLYRNQISDILSLSNLTGLQTFFLFSNQISDIRTLSNLTGLQTLDLSVNQISDIHHLAKLTKLQTLNLSSNKLSKIPSSIFQINMEISIEEYGRGLCLSDNPIQSPPIEIIKQGRQSVLDWFSARKTKLNEIKIILIGDPKAGKTSLLRRLKDNTFDKNEAQTDGVNIEDIKFGESKIFKKQKALHELTGHFWDFGGQEIMNATHQFFLTSRTVYILVLDARKDANVSAQITQWVKRIKATGGSSPIIIVANQIDINTGFGFDNKYELQKQFP
jgi:small GTP-binding protein